MQSNQHHVLTLQLLAFQWFCGCALPFTLSQKWHLQKIIEPPPSLPPKKTTLNVSTVSPYNYMTYSSLLQLPRAWWNCLLQTTFRALTGPSDNSGSKGFWTASCRASMLWWDNFLPVRRSTILSPGTLCLYSSSPSSPPKLSKKERQSWGNQ